MGRVKFQTRIYHCNVNDKGGICLDILMGDWSAGFRLTTVLNHIYYLLISPNPDYCRNYNPMDYVDFYIKNGEKIVCGFMSTVDNDVPDPIHTIIMTMYMDIVKHCCQYKRCFNYDAGCLCLKNREEYNKKAIEWTLKFAQ